MRAIVTGGSGGLGAAIRAVLAADGHEVLTTFHRNRAAGEAVALDLADLDAVAAFGPQAAAWRPDVLVNCAGEVTREGLATLSRQAVLHAMAVNCLAPLELTRAVAPGMRERGQGSIVNVGTILSAVGGHDRVAYSTSKAALIGMTKALAVELAPEVRVNALLTGLFDTAMNAVLTADPDLLAAVTARIPLGRLGAPEEFAAVVALLARPGYVTGAVWEVDGGVLARIPLPMGDNR